MTSAPPTALSLVETDAFCDCGYNLHGQPVWRDPQLELLICRCPECGKHAAAGRFTGIHSTWLHRLSLGMILLWVLFLLGTFAFMTLMLGVWPAAQISNHISWSPVPNTNPSPTTYVYDLDPPTTWDVHRSMQFDAILYGVIIFIGLLTGALAATFLWHLRLRIYLVLLLPFIALAILYSNWSGGTPLTDRAQHWLNVHLVVFAILECLAIFIGIHLGRPAARFLLHLLLPDRLLQHLSFLWYRDDKQLSIQSGM